MQTRLRPPPPPADEDGRPAVLPSPLRKMMEDHQHNTAIPVIWPAFLYGSDSTHQEQRSMGLWRRTGCSYGSKRQYAADLLGPLNSGTVTTHVDVAKRRPACGIRTTAKARRTRSRSPIVTAFTAVSAWTKSRAPGGLWRLRVRSALDSPDHLNDADQWAAIGVIDGLTAGLTCVSNAVIRCNLS